MFPHKSKNAVQFSIQILSLMLQFCVIAGSKEMRRNSSSQLGLGKGSPEGPAKAETSSKLQLAQYMLEVNFELLHSQAITLTGKGDGHRSQP